jgi:hypothetical protein
LAAAVDDKIWDMARSFDELVAEADAVSVEGWDFSWLEGRGVEERPSWGYQRLLRARLGQVQAALDLCTGGGEVLSGARIVLSLETINGSNNLRSSNCLKCK